MFESITGVGRIKSCILVRISLHGSNACRRFYIAEFAQQQNSVRHGLKSLNLLLAAPPIPGYILKSLPSLPPQTIIPVQEAAKVII